MHWTVKENGCNDPVQETVVGRLRIEHTAWRPARIMRVQPDSFSGSILCPGRPTDKGVKAVMFQDFEVLIGGKNQPLADHRLIPDASVVPR